jgi:adenylate kinase
VILMMGIAGSGKGTQSKLLADRHGFHLITTGDVLRMYVTGKQRERMLAGELLDDDEIIKIIDKVLTSIANGTDMLMDGFPRTIYQAEWLVKQAEQGRFPLKMAFHLVATRQAVKDRLLDRARQDDVDGAIEKRFEEYERSTVPLLNWLKDHGVKVIDIDAERPVEEVYADLDSHLAKAV